MAEGMSVEGTKLSPNLIVQIILSLGKFDNKFVATHVVLDDVPRPLVDLRPPRH